MKPGELTASIISPIARRSRRLWGKINLPWEGMPLSLVMFLAWVGAISGAAPTAASAASLDPLAALQASSLLAGPLIDAYSFFAIVTS
jgi:hypothetical protein